MRWFVHVIREIPIFYVIYICKLSNYLATIIPRSNGYEIHD